MKRAVWQTHRVPPPNIPLLDHRRIVVGQEGGICLPSRGPRDALVNPPVRGAEPPCYCRNAPGRVNDEPNSTAMGTLGLQCLDRPAALGPHRRAHRALPYRNTGRDGAFSQRIVKSATVNDPSRAEATAPERAECWKAKRIEIASQTMTGPGYSGRTVEKLPQAQLVDDRSGLGRKHVAESRRGLRLMHEEDRIIQPRQRQRADRTRRPAPGHADVEEWYCFRQTSPRL